MKMPFVKATTVRLDIVALVLLTFALRLLANEPQDRKTTSDQPTRGAEASGQVTLLNFDELAVDNVTGNALGRYPADHYRKLGLLIGTCDLVAVNLAEKIVRLANPVAGFEVLGGRDQPYISPYNFVLAAGGGTHDLLLTFEEPVTSVSVVSDRCIENPEVIRLMILEPIEKELSPTEKEQTATTSPQLEDSSQKSSAKSAKRTQPPRFADFRVLAATEKLDNATRAPDNQLKVELDGRSFRHVLIECTTEQEGFDDLRFTRAVPFKSPGETSIPKDSANRP